MVTALDHPEGNGLIERFHRSLKEEEVWLNEYRSLNRSAAGSPSTITIGPIARSKTERRAKLARRSRNLNH